jgi:hypothetical protein
MPIANITQMALHATAALGPEQWVSMAEELLERQKSAKE